MAGDLPGPGRPSVAPPEHDLPAPLLPDPDAVSGPAEPTLPAGASGDELAGSGAAEGDTPAAEAEAAPAWAAVPPVVGDVDQAEDPAGSLAAEISGLREEFGRRLDELHKALDRTAALQEHQATMVQKLHAENQALRQGELTQALKPFILDVARLHDDVERVISHGGAELAKAAPIPEFILDVLDRHGVSRIDPAPGDPFDPKLHQGLKVAETSDETLDGRVESVVRAGFIRDAAHLVRPAQVVVYRYGQGAPPQASDTASAPAPGGSDAETHVPTSAGPSLDGPTSTIGADTDTPITDQAGSKDVG